MMVGDDQEKVVDASKSAVTRVRFAPIKRNAPRKSTRCIDCLEKTRGLDSDALPWCGKAEGRKMPRMTIAIAPAGTLYHRTYEPGI